MRVRRAGYRSRAMATTLNQIANSALALELNDMTGKLGRS
jgi:hypothetical protein